jgi:hypothetical protein
MDTNVEITSLPDDEAAEIANDNSGAKSQSNISLSWLSKLNDEYAVVNDSGQSLIYRRVHDYSLKHARNEWMTFQAFRNLKNNLRVQVSADDSGSPRYERLGDAWLGHPKRRQYDSITFAPGENPPANVLNLWRGFAVTPKQGDWSLFKQHLHGIVCAGDEVNFNYLIGWMARCVQFPGERGEVAVVLRGTEGIGKGTLGTRFGKLFGEHFVHAQRPADLLGQFNGDLETAVFVFSDEATFAGDPSQGGTLKALITEPTIPVEQKFRQKKRVRNVVHGK